jgi:adenylate kinase family enzyme
MVKKIHILGAAGSGTTTLGIELEKLLGYKHFDTDDFLWEETNPPYQQKRPIPKREELLSKELEKDSKIVLTGSMVGWGEKLASYFDLVIYLWIPQDIRISRLREREKQKFGNEIDIGGKMHRTHTDFIEWASEYDSGDENMRSKKYHDLWLDKLNCKVLKIEGTYELDEKIKMITSVLD